MDNGPYPKSGTFPLNSMQFCAVSAGSAVLSLDTAGSRLVVVRINNLHPTELKFNAYAHD
jgi:hypothetical protein